MVSGWWSLRPSLYLAPTGAPDVPGNTAYFLLTEGQTEAVSVVLGVVHQFAQTNRLRASLMDRALRREMEQIEARLQEEEKVRASQRQGGQMSLVEALTFALSTLDSLREAGGVCERLSGIE